LSWNHLEETRPCLETLFGTTRTPCRLLIVDNASAPPVRAHLAAVTPRGSIVEVVLLQNETNEGFPRGMNRGLRASSAPFVCLLNNDLRFTDGWLEELLAVARAHPELGVLNPASNTFGSRPPHHAAWRGGVPAQQALEAHAASLAAQRGRYTEVGMCTGFCFLIRREVIGRIGGLTEEVDRVFFEDEDYSMRVQEAGFRCAVVEASYVFHVGHQSVKDMPEREALFSKNRRWCEQRWGRRLRLAWPRFTPAAPGSRELRDWLQRLVAWARRRTLVYVYCPTPDRLTRDALFESVGLVPHADIHWCPIPQTAASAAAAGLILKRRKKPFDLLVAPDPGWARWMGRLRWLHRAEIVPEADEAQLTDQWQRKSRSPS
ncbi:MAG: glycosyltransferase family 2 protein, partial [Candidatus Omnitrophica bacterium]|nr:glycosyltransferase family 2 protein [Candidatus Omnitrophota bacterium]